MQHDDLFVRLGAEQGCRSLAGSFYRRVQTSEILRPLFPGKSLRCATEEFGAFLIQFFEGDEDQTQYRWWLSLEQSHRRFNISEAQRIEWLSLMFATIDQEVKDDRAREELRELFISASMYVTSGDVAPLESVCLRARWNSQLELDRLMSLIQSGDDDAAVLLARRFLHRKSVTVGIFAEMIKTRRHRLVSFVCDAVHDDSDLIAARYNGRYLLHHAAGSGCIEVVSELLALGSEPDVLDSGGHSPLYRAASCSHGADVVRALIASGADPNLRGGVNLTAPLHEAARFGCLDVIEALIEGGARKDVVDKRGATPLDRARRCRSWGAVELLKP